MNTKNLMTRINRELGLSGLQLPFDPIEEINNIIHDTTLPVFSIYLPFKEELLIHLKRSRISYITPELGASYILPDLSPREILYVMDIRNSGDQYSSPFDYNPAFINNYQYSINVGYEELMLGMAGGMLGGVINHYITFDFIYPRTLVVYGNNLVTDSYIITFGFKHETLASIPESASESFIKLAILDAKAGLLPTLKRYDKLQTAIGVIDLHLEEWENAVNERKEYIERLDSTYQMDQFCPVFK